MKLIRLQSVKSETGYKSHASIYKAIKEGLFPKPVQIGIRSVAWPLEEVHAINIARAAGSSAHDLRVLVAGLHELRLNAFKTVRGAA